ncbi:cell division protein ZapE [Rhodococcus sp. IEGM 1379]|uniref:cell division protein ZapE n=1 Tax=Rhodococcus sp. IEGM 1379 TaxID=3047086 RepID=UPI0024B66411|nr:cell division protein ZapE [Rhodococcus sp. IEGM 1379]MDI9917559.1 cell division protein ZapE [Rhodococcus sp. IEGM 1379]
MLLDEAQLSARESLDALRAKIAAGGVGGGIYLWGGVGRGKTMLMDEFYNSLSVTKRRIHFHEFFSDLHARAHGLGSMGSALERVVDGIRVLCFDEFHIDDVADAMFMARVLDTIVTKGVTVVVTSNVPPTELLPNPLFHEQFVPSIELIEETLDIIELSGALDYRISGSGGGGDGRFASGEFIVDAGFAQRPSEPVQLRIGSRTLWCEAIRGGVVWFDFEVLCNGSTSAADYLDLVDRFDEWVVCGVPVLASASEFAVRRFGNVVDVLYDADTRLTIYADADLEQVAGTLRDVPGLARLFSRLSLLRMPSSAR